MNQSLQNYKLKKMKRSYQDEVRRNVITISYGGVSEKLFFGPGVVHLDTRVLDDSAFETDDTYGVVKTYGVKTGSQSNSTCSCFFVTFNGRLWERANIMEVGQLVNAIEEEYEVLQICEV
jgi:hypothetical protein